MRNLWEALFGRREPVKYKAPRGGSVMGSIPPTYTATIHPGPITRVIVRLDGPATDAQVEKIKAKFAEWVAGTDPVLVVEGMTVHVAG